MLIEDLYDNGRLSVLYGEHASGKTSVALDLAASVAAGDPWNGRTTTQAGAVYVATQGRLGLAKRAAALRLRRGRIGEWFQVAIAPGDFSWPTEGVSDFLSTLDTLERPVGLVVFDPLAGLTRGQDDGDADVMRSFLRSFGKIQEATGAHVLVVHHASIAEAHGTPGHALLREAADVEMAIEGRTLVATKRRGSGAGFSVDFAIEPVVIGADAEHDPITAARVRFGVPDDYRATSLEFHVSKSAISR